ncbi:MAG: PQQ-dependent sugar dehydrogenase [Alphaproteobacteria bacterium]
MPTARNFAAAASFVLASQIAGTCVFAETTRGPKPQKVEDKYIARPAGVAVATWIEGLEAPWSLAFLPDGRALVSERPGRIRMIRGAKLLPAPVALIRSALGGEGGLMGLAVHPGFPAQPFIYAMHTYRGAGGRANRVIRLRLTGARAVFDKVILDNIPGARNHNGGRIAFGPDGLLYIGTGERYQREIAQDRKSLGGKILRVTADGAIPAGNPYPGSPVYSIGHRNIQGLAWHPSSKELFISEHGPSGEVGVGAHDEINVIRKGGNYGWPRVIGAPGLKGYIDPIVAWPQISTPPSGAAFWRGDLYIATLRSRALIRISFQRGAGKWRATAIERWFVHANRDAVYGRLRDAVVGPDGALYVLTNNRDGRGSPRRGDDRILRITAR